MIKGVIFIIGSQAFVIERVQPGFPADNLTLSLKELDFNLAGNFALKGGKEILQGNPQGRKPESVIDQLAVFGLDRFFKMQAFPIQHQGGKILVGSQQNGSGRRFVDFPGLYADQSVFHHIDSAHSIGRANFI